jgi:hypothetical protein
MHIADACAPQALAAPAAEPLPSGPPLVPLRYGPIPQAHRTHHLCYESAVRATHVQA